MQKASRQYAGKLALITGASAGLGKAYAKAYAAKGADLVLVARREERLRDLASKLEAEHGIRAHVITQDLAVRDAHVPIMQALSALGVMPDILVNNAGFSIPSTFLKTEWGRQRDFNMTLVMAVCGLAHACAPSMVEKGWGRIINIGSMIAWVPGGYGHTLYPAAKAYVVRFSQSLAEELRGTGVNVTATCPGSTATEFQVANGMAEETDENAGAFVQTAQQVVAASLRASEKGRRVHVTGWHNKAAVSLLRYLPTPLTVPLIRMATKKQRSGEGNS